MENQKPLSTQEVEKILTSLENEKTKEALLKKLYTPGNKEIANLLIPYDRSVVEKELLFALQLKDQERIMEMAKKEIDYYLENGLHMLLTDMLEGWDNPGINAYVLSKVQDGKDEEELQQNLHILEKIGTPAQIKKTRETLLAIALQDTEYPNFACDILIKLGRYEEAIDRRLKCFSDNEYYLIRCARQTAEEHAPQRKDEIAQLVFDHGIKRGEEELFYECGVYLGKTDKVKDLIADNIHGILYKGGSLLKIKKDITDEPRFFNKIALAMKNLGGFEKEIMALAAQIEVFVNKKDDYFADIYKEMANFYNVIGNKEKSLEWFGKALDYEIERCHPSHAISTMDKVEGLYGEGNFEDKKILMFEKDGKYAEAARFAEKLGLKEKAEAYRKTAKILE